MPRLLRIPTRIAPVLVAATVLVVAATACVPTTPTIASVTYRGKVANPSAPGIRRDGATSVLLGGKVVWAFGDSFAIGASTLWSSTAALATPAAPLSLSEPTVNVGGGNLGPASTMIPKTAAEAADEAAHAGLHYLYWPGSIIPEANGTSAIVFSEHLRSQDVCDAGGQNCHQQLDSLGLNVARLQANATTATNLGDIIPAPAKFLNSIFLDPTSGTVYLYDCSASAPDLHGTLGLCKVAKVDRANMLTRSAYRFYDGTNWVTDIAAAVPTVPGNGGSIQWNAYLQTYISLNINGAIRWKPDGKPDLDPNGLPQADWVAEQLRTSFSPFGAASDWSTPITACGTPNATPAPPAGCTFDPATIADHFPYAERIHPALSSADGRTIALSWYVPDAQPTDWFKGDVKVYDLTFGPKPS